MSTETRDTEFTEDLRQFLISIGFTHILSLGADDTENGPNGGEDKYWVTPVRKNDPRLQYEETDIILQEINSSDVLDMVSGVDFIKFIIKVPVYFYEVYANKRKI